MLLGELAGTGGIFTSAMRHIRLMSEQITVVPIACQLSFQESDWGGRVEKSKYFGIPAYRIFASDFRSDRAFLPDFGDMFINSDLRQRAYTDRLEEIVKKENLQAIHVYGAFELRPLIGAYVAVKCDIPLIITFRGSDLETRIFGRNLAQLMVALNVAHACVCNSQASLRILKGLLRPACPSYLIYNHVNPRDFNDLESLNLSINPPVIGCIGEFRRLMGLDYLLSAFEKIASKRNASLMLGGPFRTLEASYYTRLVDSHPFSHRIFRIGTIPHEKMLSYLTCCDIVAYPSVSDSCPNKVLEAMLAGRAVVASNRGGIPDLIDDGKEGILVPPKEIDSITSAIEQLLDNPELRSKLGHNSRIRALEQFTPDYEQGEWIKVYKKICS